MKNIIQLRLFAVAMLVLLQLSAFAQHPQLTFLGTYNSAGLPDYLEPDMELLSQAFLDRIAASVPESQPVPEYHPDYISGDYQATLELEEAGEVFVTYVAEGAGYKNVLGFYTYPTGNPPTAVNQIDSITIVFPNVSQQGSGGELIPGHKVKLGMFDAGTTIGFVCLSNGFNSGNATVGHGIYQHYSNKELNTPVDAENKEHTVVLYDSQSDRYVLAFEDITRPGGDQDFNDAMFFATSNPPEIIAAQNVVQLPVLWHGTYSSDWFNPQNWDPAIVPDSNTSATILASAANNPLIDGHAYVGDLVVEPWKPLNILPGSKLSVYNNITATTLQMNTGEVSFDGSGLQKCYGQTMFHHVTVNNGAELQVNDDITIGGSLMLENGDFNPNGNNVVFASTNAKNSLILDNGGSVLGSVTLQKHVPSPSGYHYYSCPVGGQTLANLNDDYALVGLGGDLNTYPFPNMWIYDETVISPEAMTGWVTPTDLTHPMNAMDGFAFNVGAGAVLEVTGMPNTGVQTKQLSYTFSTNDYEDHCPPDGWNLVGNPYPSPMDWDMVNVPAEMENGIYMWDAASEQYATYIDGVGVNGGTPYIPSCQGFMVRTDANVTLQFDNTARVGTDTVNELFKGAPDPLVKLRLTGAGYADETVVRFKEDASAQFDRSRDCYKMRASNPQAPFFCTAGDKFLYAINTFGALEQSLVVPLVLDVGVSQTYTINPIELEGFAPGTQVLLEDKQLGIMHDLSTGAYAFNIQSTSETDRFNLLFTPADPANGVSTHELDAPALRAYAANNTLYLSGIQQSETAAVQLFSVLGQPVLQRKISLQQGSATRVQLPAVAAGTYILRVRTSNGMLTQKINLR